MNFSGLQHVTLNRSPDRHAFPPAWLGDNADCRPVAKHWQNLRQELTFLEPYVGMLQSIVLVGSTVYGLHDSTSDLDLVVIAKDGNLEKVCDILFEKEIDAELAGQDREKIEYTVISESQTEELFSLVSPFSFSIRYGIPLLDRGYLKNLLRRTFPSVPPREFYTKALFENIVCQYFSVLKSLEGQVRAMNCSEFCCQNGKSCQTAKIGLKTALIIS